MVNHIVSVEDASKLIWTDWTSCPVTNRLVEQTLTEEQKDVIQTDYMWTTWDRSLTYEVAPNIDDLLDTWQEEQTRA